MISVFVVQKVKTVHLVGVAREESLVPASVALHNLFAVAAVFVITVRLKQFLRCFLFVDVSSCLVRLSHTSPDQTVCSFCISLRRVPLWVLHKKGLAVLPTHNISNEKNQYLPYNGPKVLQALKSAPSLSIPSIDHALGR